MYGLSAIKSLSESDDTLFTKRRVNRVIELNCLLGRVTKLKLGFDRELLVHMDVLS